MKPELREKLAQQSFEEKIRKVGELIQLSRRITAGRVAEDSHSHSQSGVQNSQSASWAKTPKK
jgi:hypothetical protein